MGKQFSYRDVTTQLEMYTEVLLDHFLCEQETKLTEEDQPVVMEFKSVGTVLLFLSF